MRGVGRPMEARPVAAALSLAVLALLALPSPAPAATAVSINDNVIRAVSDPGEDNQVEVGYDIDNGHLLVADSAEGVTVAAPCVLVAGHAECTTAGSERPRFIVRSGDGQDTVNENLLLVLLEPFFNAQGFRPILVKLGAGDDLASAGQGSSRMLGGPGNDRMFGFDGSDTLIGGPGNDVLDRRSPGNVVQPNFGRDRYLGGPGADRIRAHDFTRDLKISCGPGRDSLGRDRFDPRPSRCP